MALEIIGKNIWLTFVENATQLSDIDQCNSFTKGQRFWKHFVLIGNIWFHVASQLFLELIWIDSKWGKIMIFTLLNTLWNLHSACEPLVVFQVMSSLLNCNIDSLKEICGSMVLCWGFSHLLRHNFGSKNFPYKSCIQEMHCRTHDPLICLSSFRSSKNLVRQSLLFCKLSTCAQNNWNPPIN